MNGKWVIIQEKLAPIVVGFEYVDVQTERLVVKSVIGLWKIIFIAQLLDIYEGFRGKGGGSMKTDWIDLNLPYWSWEGKSFEGLNLNKPGTIIDTKQGIFLIGHINPLRTICDDDKEFDDHTIIERYKVIWTVPEGREKGEA